MKKKLNDLDYINNNICTHLKKEKNEINKHIEEEPLNDEEKKQQELIYKKINSFFKKNILKEKREKNKMLRNKFLLNNDEYIYLGQTNPSSNHILTTKSSNNKICVTNNRASISYSSFQNQEKTNEKIKTKEIKARNKPTKK